MNESDGTGRELVLARLGISRRSCAPEPCVNPPTPHAWCGASRVRIRTSQGCPIRIARGHGGWCRVAPAALEDDAGDGDDIAGPSPVDL